MIDVDAIKEYADDLRRYKVLGNMSHVQSVEAIDDLIAEVDRLRDVLLDIGGDSCQRTVYDCYPTRSCAENPRFRCPPCAARDALIEGCPS